MSEEPRIYQEGETVPVPDKGGWIDGETGQVLPTPPPDVIEPQPGVVQTEPKAEPKAEPTPEPPAPRPKKAA
jgi:pyruvate/2-oxoglutarate dehydrogenase complex dihydrolipoamide acyltransferase (E2) component